MRVFVFLIVRMVLLAGCDGGPNDPPPDRPDPPETDNAAPTADLTLDTSEVEIGTEVALDGSGSSDPDGDDLTYSWRLAAAPSGSDASLADEAGITADFTPDATGDYVVKLEVSDGEENDTDDGSLEAMQAVVEITENISSDRTLTSDETYRFPNTDPVDIKEGVTVTIEPDTELRFAEEAGLDVFGTLRAEGTAEDSITMTATRGNRQPGWWRGVECSDGTSVLDHVQIRYAGADRVPGERAASIYQSGSSEADLQLTNSTIESGRGCGLAVVPNIEATLQTFSENELRELEKPPVCIPFAKVGIFDGSNSFPPQSAVEVFEAPIESGIEEKTRMRSLDEDIPYRVTEDVTVSSDTLVIKAGVHMTFAENVQLEVFAILPAAIEAQGTAGNPIRMTATEGNEMPGWWQGIYLRDDFGGTLSNVIIRHGGGTSSPANITAEQVLPGLDAQGSLTVENSRIEDSGKHGIACNDAGIDLTAQGNALAGIPGKPITGCGTE